MSLRCLFSITLAPRLAARFTAACVTCYPSDDKVAHPTRIIDPCFPGHEGPLSSLDPRGTLSFYGQPSSSSSIQGNTLTCIRTHIPLVLSPFIPLKSAFGTIHGFSAFLQKRGKSLLSSFTQEDLEAFVDSQQDRRLKPLSAKSNLRQVQTLLRYLIPGGNVSSDVLARPIRIKVPDALPRAMDPLDMKRLLSVV